MKRLTGAIGLAVGPELFTAAIGAECRRFAPAELPVLLEELAGRVPLRRRVLAVALLPPLVELKRLDLPPLARRDAERVLARDAERYFLRRSARQVVSAERLGRRGVLWAAAAPGELVEQLYTDAESRGWRIASVVPAHAAWIAAARQRSGLRGGSRVVAVALPASTEVLAVANGRVASLRRLPPEPDPAATGRRVVAEDVPVILLGGDSDPAPDEIAARFASRSGWLDLVPEERLSAMRRRVAGAARLLAGVAAGLTLLAAGVDRWGTARELRNVLEARGAHAPRVAEAMAVRSALEDWTRRLAALETAERDGVVWAAVLATLAEHLPADAHLRALRGAGDSLLLEGVALRAAASFEALQRAPAIQGVRATAPIQQEPADSGPARERFVLAARLRLGREGGP